MLWGWSFSSSSSSSSSSSLVRFFSSSDPPFRIEFPRSWAILTLNLLAPIYKRMSSEFDRESSYPFLFEERARRCVRMILDGIRVVSGVPHDFALRREFVRGRERHGSVSWRQGRLVPVFCFQELWFDDDYLPFFQGLFPHRLSWITKQRGSHKRDGIAIAYDESECNLVEYETFHYQRVADRVAMVAAFEDRETKQRCIVANTHLTFPHQKIDELHRLEQARQFSATVLAFADLVAPGAPIFAVGDFNGYNDEAYLHMTQVSGFASSYSLVHQAEPGATHRTHRNLELATDFIFLKGPAENIHGAYILPTDVPSEAFPSIADYSISDHRAILVKYAQEPFISSPSQVPYREEENITSSSSSE